MQQLRRVRCTHLNFVRLINSQTQLTEPTITTAPRVEKVDNFCEHIKNITLPVDWDLVKYRFEKTSAKGLKYGFEIRTINCILTSKPPISSEVIRSLFQYINPSSDVVGKNPIFDIHLAALCGWVDANAHADVIKNVVVDISEKHSDLTKYKAYAEAVTLLASTGKENCELATRLSIGKGLLSDSLALQCLKYGMHEMAFSNNTSKVDYDVDLQPWIDSFLAFEFREETLHKFLEMVWRIAGTVPPSCSQSLQSLLHKVGYEIRSTQLDDKSACVECGTQMTGITDDEYARCIQICRERVLHKGDTFVNSSPREVRSYLKLINHALYSGNYYDVVLDALNVAHVTHPYVYSLDPAPRHDGRIVKMVKSKATMVHNIRRTMESALKTFPRMLVIGRVHMRQWPGLAKVLESNQKVDVFYLENISEDDPFIIYAAMQSPRTYVISNDHFRDHKFLMHDHLFERWLRSRLIRAPKDGRSFAIPPRHENRVNISPDWKRLHIPVGYNNTSFTTWLCCHKK